MTIYNARDAMAQIRSALEGHIEATDGMVGLDYLEKAYDSQERELEEMGAEGERRSDELNRLRGVVKARDKEITELAEEIVGKMHAEITDLQNEVTVLKRLLDAEGVQYE